MKVVDAAKLEELAKRWREEDDPTTWLNHMRWVCARDIDVILSTAREEGGALREAFVDCVRWIANHESVEGTWFPTIEQAESKAARRYPSALASAPAADGRLAQTIIDQLREDTCSEDDEGVPFYDAALADNVIRSALAAGEKGGE